MGFGEGVSPSACASGTGNIKRQRGRKRKRTTLSQFWKSHLDTNNRAQTLELNQFTLQKKPWSKHHALSPCFVLFFFLLQPPLGGSHRISPDRPLAPSLTFFCLPWPSSSNCNPLNSPCLIFLCLFPSQCPTPCHRTYVRAVFSPAKINSMKTGIYVHFGHDYIPWA